MKVKNIAFAVICTTALLLVVIACGSNGSGSTNTPQAQSAESPQEPKEEGQHNIVVLSEIVEEDDDSVRMPIVIEEGGLIGSRVTIGNVEGKPGKVVNVPVDMYLVGEDEAGVFDISIAYDPEKLTDPKISKGKNFPEGWRFGRDVRNEKKNSVKFFGVCFPFNSENLKELEKCAVQISGRIAIVQFKIADNAASNTEAKVRITSAQVLKDSSSPLEINLGADAVVEIK